MRFLYIIAVLSVVGLTLGRDIPGVKSTEKFDQAEILDEKDNYILFWKYNDTHVTFEVHVKTRGWVGFGISGNGDMYPADVIVGWVTDDGKTHFSDRHTVGHSPPVRDASQDWFLLYGEENDFGTVLKFVRRVDTCDAVGDKAIPEATTRVIFAYGTSDPVSEDGITYHGVSRGTKSLALRSAYRVPDNMPTDVKHYDFLNQNFVIPSDGTTYWCKGFQMPDLGGKHHMIKYEPVITPGNEMHVHHILLYRCKGIPTSSDGVSGNCYSNRPHNLPGCDSMILAWAIGGQPFYFPDNAGFSVAAPDDAMFYIMETHYDNPTLKAGMIDDSGIRITLTEKLRPMEAGLLEMGETVSLYTMIPPHQSAYLSKGYCSENCLRHGMAAQNLSEIRIFSAFQHAHLLGVGMTTRHYRNGTELQPLIKDDNYDFDFQENRLLPQERHVYPGDSFRVDCTYDSSKRTTVTFGGLSTKEEMCLTFAYYYPRIPSVNCISSPTYSAFNLHRSQLENYALSADWTDQQFLSEFERKRQISTTYHRCSGDHFHPPSNHETFVEKDDQTPYVAPSPVCT